MEIYKRQCINELRVEISRIEKSQQRDRDTYDNILKIMIDKTLALEKKNQLSSAMEKREQDILNLQNRISLLQTDSLDEELKTQIKKQSEIQLTKQTQTKKKKQTEQKVNTEKRNQVYEKQNKEFSDERQAERDWKYFYKQSLKCVETLPNYMRQNLSEMSGNKGYIWRGCYFFGLLPEEPNQPTLMFEKGRNGILYIHEYDKYEYRLFEKQGRERKQLVLKKQRKQKKSFKRF